ncbi:hypothetical protein BP6252_08207 [Coleophoma cylindrospora]|uniref:Amino acid permease/ SLC12A domain-containing protein n=1 Tax=Coleophoma cylindrospora TaxID=1849047 RepID=A0A3D8RCP5_9HELO|nr:hypothetical protein BP6252_08207 [Coleophoma cylindrospora]
MAFYNDPATNRQSQAPSPSWIPDWLGGYQPGRVRINSMQSEELLELPAQPRPARLPRSAYALGNENTPNNNAHINEGPTINRITESNVNSLSDASPIVIREINHNTYDPSRAVKRELQNYHIFFIALSGTLGVGLYVQGGAMLRLGGPWALIFSFVALSLLAYSVMQCITEMLCIWPIPGALHIFVAKFIDEELGLAVGLAYWFSNSMGFAAILIAFSQEVATWSSSGLLRGFFSLSTVPLVILLINMLGVKPYATIELVFGSLKLLFVATVLTILLAIRLGAGENQASFNSIWHPKHYDTEAAKNYTAAFLMCLPIAAFAFVGIEMSAATALEARVETRQAPVAALKSPATRLPILVGFIYFIGGVMIAVNIDSNDSFLPQQGWVKSESSSSRSAFVLIAQASKIPGLGTVFTIFLVITAVTAANTDLYIASRTLFSLARPLPPASKLQYFGKTHGQVPIRALVMSCFFLWVPFLSYAKNSTVTSVFDVMSAMSSVSCVMVWFFECWAFYNFFRCTRKHERLFRLNSELVPGLARFHDPDDPERNYEWHSHFQPWTARFAMFGCLFILTVANSASQWKGFNSDAFLGSFLSPIIVFVLWIALKLRSFGLRRDRPWVFGVRIIQDGIEAERTFKELHDITQGSIPQSTNIPPDIRALGPIREFFRSFPSQNMNSGQQDSEQTLRFISSEQPPYLSPDTQALIRTHVMEDFVRKGRQRKDNAPARGTTQPTGTAGRVRRFKLQSGELRPTFTQPKQPFMPTVNSLLTTSAGEQVQQTSNGSIFWGSYGSHPALISASEQPSILQDTMRSQAGPSLEGSAFTQRSVTQDLGVGLLDPFDTLPFPLNSRLDLLIRNYHMRIGATPLMRTLRKNILELSLHDEALFHVTMSHSAAYWNSLTQRGHPKEGLVHLAEAVKVIRKRLNNPLAHNSDGTVGAIAAMACYEVDITKYSPPNLLVNMDLGNNWIVI